MYDKALSTINKQNLIKNGDKVICAVSGGADSMALLVFLWQAREMFRIEVCAVHLNHMLRGLEAERDAKFTEEFCRLNGIPFYLFERDAGKLAAERKVSTEEAGRLLRYEAFEELRHRLRADKVATAHNKNDDAETFLMRLSRGTGTKGLCGIPYRNGYVIRPLLDCSRADITRFLDERGVSYVTDSTNLEDVYTRNKVRRFLIPWIEENVNAAAVDNIARTMEILREQYDYLTLQSVNIIDSYVKEMENGLYVDINMLNRLHIALEKEVIRGIISKVTDNAKDIDNGHIADIIALKGKETGKRIDMPCGIVCEKSYERLLFRNSLPDSAGFCYELAENSLVYVTEKGYYVSLSYGQPFFNQNLKNICTKTYKCDRIFGYVKIRTRLPGDTIKTTRGTKKIKKLLIDGKVARESRERLVIVEADGVVLSALPFADSCNYVNGSMDCYVQIWN